MLINLAELCTRTFGRQILKSSRQRSPLESTFCTKRCRTQTYQIGQHVIEVLGRYGYRRATVSRIARRAGLTPGAVLPSGSTKAALIASAANELVRSPLEVWESFVDRNGGDTSGTARARFVREIVRPEHDVMRRVNLELARVAESVDEFAGFRAPRDVLQQTHQGLMFVACFVSDLHELPYLGPFRLL